MDGLRSQFLIQGAIEPDFHNLEVFGNIDLAEVLQAGDNVCKYILEGPKIYGKLRERYH